MNIGDAESAYQEGRVMFLEFKRDFTKEWFAPLMRAQLAAMVASLSVEDIMTPGMETVLPVLAQLLGGNDASTRNATRKLEIPWTGSPSGQGGRPAPGDEGNY